MSTAAVGLSVEEYLSTSYRPDCDYVDGMLEERNLGEFDHSLIQGLICAQLLIWAKQSDAYVLPEQRVKVRAGRYRIPDVCLIRREDREPVISKPPLLCVEVLSPCDTLHNMVERLNDYIAMGVPVCWVVDPAARRGYTFDRGGLHPVEDGIMRLEATTLELSLDALFAEF